MAQNSSTTAAPAWAPWPFAGATLLGAFLLFQVQPLIGKFILPWFGGAPAVWTTCMLFFQIALFGGYAYSHLLVSRLAPRGQFVVQGLLLLAALTALPIAPSASWKPADSSNPTVRILLLLAATVGLPYFVLSTTSPLVQAWFSRRFPGRPPYRLYALSNFGSLLALLSYPLVFEPACDLATQSRLWSWAFPLYAALTAVCGATAWRSSRAIVTRSVSEGVETRSVSEAIEARSASEGVETRNASEAIETRNASEGIEARSASEVEASTTSLPRNRMPLRASMPATSPAPRWPQRALWLLLPACASLVLLATTNHVCQDVAVVPFLWVAPLSLYLLTFIICFDRPGWYVRPLWASLAVMGIAAVTASDRTLDWLTERYRHEGMSLTYAHQLVLHFGAMFAIAMVCHGELVRLRPGARRLTEFYLLLAAGGALGGAVVSLAAPHVFKTFLEWNLGMLAAYVLATVVLFRAVPKTGRRRTAALLLCGFAAGGFAPVLLWQGDFRPRAASDPRLLDRQRNFYGVVSVWECDGDRPELRRRLLRHGAILHGQQFLAAEKRRLPLNYYVPESGIGRAFAELRKRHKPLRVGIAGLGAGTLACYARAGDRFTFYEINPAVRDMAEKYFTYLADARGSGATVDLVMGDARLALERQPSQGFDLLVLDAFSGDSVPVHLLTREAMEIYRRHVAADGAIALHATNTYLYLVPVVRALAEDARLGWRRVHTTEDAARFRFRGDWVVASGRQDFLDAIPNVPPPPEQGDNFLVPVWTDQNNNLFRILVF